MASSSSSSNMASPAADDSSFDVFLSFRGEDVRHSFADHLYEALKWAGFHTFRDEEEINKGEPLKPEIVQAIKGSKASIVVLSENYATSTWCLDELSLILQQRKDSSHFVLPVFYKVDPSDVRKQKNSFAIEVQDSSRWTVGNVNMWKEALTEVADLSGEVSEGHEAKLVKKIVDLIYDKMDHKKLPLPDNLIGMGTRYEEIRSLINEPNVNILAICGMGGSGKTTLAKYIYNSNLSSFENMSYLEDIGSRCKGYDELLQQQTQLLHDILRGKNRKVPSVSEATSDIKEALKTKRVFIVLDDIANHDQLVALLGTGEINAESKIVITTTILNIEDLFSSGSRRWRKYEMRLLNDDGSLELLCRHAVKSKFPNEGFRELALKAVRYCEGNPLALEVLGSSLSENNSTPVWESTLNSFEKNLHDKIRGVLIGSYNSLPFDCNKKLFLHIACFFVGKDKDYVEKILEGDCSAMSGIKILSNRCLLSVSPNNKLMMQRLLQEVGKDIVFRESEVLTQRSRVWHSRDSYKILSKRKGSEKVEGLALDMEMLKEENFSIKSSKLKTDALNDMDNLKLLQLKSVQLTGSYESFSEDLIWLCWFGFHLETIPSDLLMGNLVAIDMSCSKLEVFEPPTELKSLKILNFKDSDNLLKINNMYKIPHLEILILWNCRSLVRVCETIENLKALALLNMTGCEKLFKNQQTNLLVGPEASTFGGEVAEQPTFPFPHSLHRLFLKGCNLECTDLIPLSFIAQPSLQYLNLGKGQFEFLPDYNHLVNLRVLDLSFCSRLKSIICLPSTLAELYVYYCESLERITFESHQFTLQEFGYKGCISLSEVEGLFKLVPVAKLEENDLGHMKWLKEYQNHDICLVGDVELTKGRSSCVQMLYEFNTMSTSLPDIKGLIMNHAYLSASSSLSFDVPLCPKSRRLKGLDVTFKYTILGDVWAWLCKISITNHPDLMYSPKVFGKPESGEVGMWLSYWPIGNTLKTGDQVNVSIIVLSGLEVHQCGVSLVYTADEVADTKLENNMGWEEFLGGDFSGFQLSTGAYYLCRRDFFELMEVGRLTTEWFRNLVGYTIDVTEVRGWRETGRPKQSYRSFTELKSVRCIINGPELEEFYKIPETSKSSFVESVLNSTSGSYDVFLSFSGEDTRHSFTDHLYNALWRAGINTFRDNEEIDRGEELKPEIERVIKESRASIVVLSRNYATSTWCLDELLLILQQRRERNHFVLPVFYDVDPSDLRSQVKSFAMEVKASSRWTDHDVNQWKKALREVADLDGMVSFGPETKFVKEVVDTIYNILDRKELHLPINLTGMATRYKEINSWLNRSNVEFLTICGMGGSGKTTLAKYIYNMNRESFENTSFVEDIGVKCGGSRGLLEPQEQLLKDILGGKRKISSFSQGTSKIEEALQTKRTLIVLDGIAEHSQLVALLGTGKINPQSKIIITTRVLNIEEWFKSRTWGCQKYEMRLLDDDESMELLSLHAFRSKIPMKGSAELAGQAIRYCEGNPLALEVLGVSLSLDIHHWESILNSLEGEIPDRIQSVLIRSFNSLPREAYKELFLHIACFFVGKDKDYVTKILEHDYSASSGIKILSNRGLLSISPNKKLMMHPLLQEMGRTIVRQEAQNPIKRSRVWLSSDSYNILRRGKGSITMEGLALDMEGLWVEEFPIKFTTDALKRMDELKLLQLNFVQLTGSYENISKHLRWLCWHGFHLRTIPSDLFMGNLVALDMSYSKLEVFEPPMVLQSLEILDLKDSYCLYEIRNMYMMPHLETLIVCYCYSLVRVCATIGDLTRLAILNMTGCINLFQRKLEDSISSGGVAERPTYSFPRSLQRLFLNNCSLEFTDSFPLSFSDQPSLLYLNLGYGRFEFLPLYNHLKYLRVLDLSFCSRLEQLLCLPSTLAELYVSYCESLERITFESHQFTLQEFGYKGCISLSEVEGLFKLVPVARLEENDLGHLKWLKKYQNHAVWLVGDDGLTKRRSPRARMLYEFDIVSTSLPDIKDPHLKPDYVSELSSLSFEVPSCPKGRRLKGLDVTFKYRLSGDDDGPWFCIIRTTNGDEWMYNPEFYGKPDSGEVGIWLSYWPIGNTLNTGDKVDVYIAVMRGLEVRECGVSLVYADDEEVLGGDLSRFQRECGVSLVYADSGTCMMETSENKMGWEEVLGGDLSRFQLSTGAYYLCRRDFFKLMEVGRLTPGWFSILVGDTADVTEVRGWRKTGRPMQMNLSYRLEN